MNGLGFLGLAFALTWAGIAFFLLSVTRRQRALEQRIADLTAPEKKGTAK